MAKAEAIKLEHELPEIVYTQIDGSDLSSVWLHLTFPGWIVCRTIDGRFWLDTDPADYSSTCLITQDEAQTMMGGQIVANGQNIFKVPV
jgi:hypothetical protein